MQHPAQPACHKKIQRQCPNSGRQRFLPFFPAGSQKHHWYHQEHYIETIVTHSRHTKQSRRQQYKLFPGIKALLFLKQLQEQNNNKKHSRRIQSILGGTKHIHLNHRKKSKIQQAYDTEPFGSPSFTKKSKNIGKTARHNSHLKMHIKRDPRIIRGKQFISQRYDPSQEQHMQKRMMRGELPHRHLIEFILGVIYKKAGIDRQKNNSPHQHEKKKNHQILPKSMRMLFPADRNNTFPFQPYPKLPDEQSKEKSEKGKGHPYAPVRKIHIPRRFQPASEQAGHHKKKSAKKGPGSPSFQNLILPKRSVCCRETQPPKKD